MTPLKDKCTEIILKMRDLITSKSFIEANEYMSRFNKNNHGSELKTLLIMSKTSPELQEQYKRIEKILNTPS